MYVHRPSKTVFLATPHTGSRSVADALQCNGFKTAQWIHSQTQPDIDELVIDWDQGVGAHHLTFAEQPPDAWDVITTVRNHWDILGTHRAMNASRKFDKEFIDWLGPECAQAYLMPWYEEGKMFELHLRWATTILPYENLGEALNQALTKRGLGIVLLPWIGRNDIKTRIPYQVFYDEETRHYVGEKFEEEINRLGYSWDDAGGKYPW